jgi:hypothetical protein
MDKVALKISDDLLVVRTMEVNILYIFKTTLGDNSELVFWAGPLFNLMDSNLNK